MNITIDISAGEFLDKLSILKIKLDKISDIDKKTNIKKEHDLYMRNLQQTGALKNRLDGYLGQLIDVNEKLWDIENRIRHKEAQKEFDEEFISLARSVYKNNDKRSDIKRQINEELGSTLVEEKSYNNY